MSTIKPNLQSVYSIGLESITLSLFDNLGANIGQFILKNAGINEVCQADLAISVFVDNLYPNKWDTILATVLLQNLSSITTTNANVSISLPDGLELKRYSNDSGEFYKILILGY